MIGHSAFEFQILGVARTSGNASKRALTHSYSGDYGLFASVLKRDAGKLLSGRSVAL